MTTASLSDESLYARIGGKPSVTAAVEGLYERILADPDLAHYFRGVRMEQLKAHQRSFITMALGGPDKHTGRPLRDAHRGLHVSGTAFARVVAHLTDTLGALGVDNDTITVITGALAPLEAQIVAAS